MGVENLGNTICRLRRKKGVTQETLADFIGVTKASVSKWETGSTLPDIQVLPLLAVFFEVTVDELVGYVPMLSREQIRFHYQRLAGCFAARPFAEVKEEWEDMVRKYYSCYPFLLQMAVLLLNHLDRAGEGQEREEAYQTVFKLCDHILEDCRDARICRNAMAVKAVLHLMEGRADLALESLEQTGSGPDSLDGVADMEGSLWVMAYLAAGEKDKAGRAAQAGMYQSLMSLVNYGIYLLRARGEDKTYGELLLGRLDQVMATFDMTALHPNMAAIYEYQAALYLAARELAEAGRAAESEKMAEAGRAAESAEPANPGTLSDVSGSADARESLAAGTSGPAGSGKLSGPAQEAVFARLERYLAACKQLFADGIKLHGDDFFDRMEECLEEMDLGTEGVRSADSVRNSVLEGLRSPLFACLEDQDRLQELGKAFRGEENQSYAENPESDKNL